MRRFFTLSALVLSLVLILGSSGNFRGYGGDRDAVLQVASNESSYIAFVCPETEYSVESGESFVVMTLTNNLNEIADFYIESEGNIIQFNNPVTLYSGESSVINGTFIGNAGNFAVPITIYASWANGSAMVESCIIEISDPPVELKKILIDGDETVKTGVKESWTFRIELINHGFSKEFTIKDVIPAEFEISEIVVSNGNYTITQSGNGAMGSTKIFWTVKTSGMEYIEITISTKLNPAGKQEFTSPGIYFLNSGAELLGYETASNGILIHVEDDEEEEDDEDDEDE